MRVSSCLISRLSRLVASSRSFAACTAGNYSIIFAFTLIPLMGAVGLAVDFGRAQLSRDELQIAVDSAVLAAARKANLDETALEAYAKNYMAANSSFDIDHVNVHLSKTATGVALSASVNVKTYLMPVLGYDSVAINAGTEVMVGTGDVEVALMLDVTGSMCADGEGPCSTSPKLDGLKSAAQALVDIIVTGDQSERATRVSLVPFSTRVRVGVDGEGAAMMAAMTDMPATWTGWREICTSSSGSGGSEGEGDWTCHAHEPEHEENWKIMPCVTDRFYNSTWSYGATDAAPGTGTWLNAHGGDRALESWDSAETPLTTETGQTSADPSYNWNYAPDGYCADVREANILLPLTSDKEALTDRIAGLEAYGSTAGALGTAMAWYTLSPHWSGVFTGASAPGSYADLNPDPLTGVAKLKKAAVLMTDGVYNTYRGWKGADQQTVSDWAIEVCDNMKAAGIEVYTVGFSLSELPVAERTIAEATLSDCATDSEHYYDADTVGELTQAFQAIGTKLSALRLTR
ncbi:MAG: pilus assembly protein [Hyphomicrobiaceae bacterium]